MAVFSFKAGPIRNFALGSAAATGWYASTAALFAGQPDYYLPVGGAIALAGLIPAAFSKSGEGSRDAAHDQRMNTRLELLDQHVLVNVVDENFLLTEVNDQLVQATGFLREELVGQPFTKLYCTETGQEKIDEIKRAQIEGRTWQGETPLRGKDGMLITTQTTVIPLFDEDGKWAGSIAARTDISGDKQLQAEREKVETLDELRDDIWIIDAETEFFTYMNHVAAERTGWTEDSYLDMTLSKLCAQEEGAAAIASACRELGKTGSGMTHFETRLGGTPFVASVKLFGQDAEARYLVILNDQTSREAEERKQSDFIAMVSHELRSPLTSIKGSMGLLLSNATGELPDKALALLEIAHRNADRLVLIINDILDLEKIAAGRMEFELQDTDMAELVKETDQSTEMLQKRYMLSVDTIGVDAPLPIKTDPTRVIQVLTNFLSNACKFSKPNGKIVIEAQEQTDQLRVSVTDEGPGIPVSEQHKIFERFADLENSDRAAKGGTGLGLSICKAIIENLGGTIGFETEEGVGTTFYFVLPRKERATIEHECEEEFREAS